MTSLLTPPAPALVLPVWASPAPATRPALRTLDMPDLHAPPLQPVLPEGSERASVTATGEVSSDAAFTAQRIARALAEVLAGSRPVAQIRPALVPRVAHLLDHLIRSGAASGARLARVRLQSPHADAVEASLLLIGERGGAVAVRIDRHARRWAVTAVEAALGPNARFPART